LICRIAHDHGDAAAVGRREGGDGALQVFCEALRLDRRLKLTAIAPATFTKFRALKTTAWIVSLDWESSDQIRTGEDCWSAGALVRRHLVTSWDIDVGAFATSQSGNAQWFLMIVVTPPVHSESLEKNTAFPISFSAMSRFLSPPTWDRWCTRAWKTPMIRVVSPRCNGVPSQQRRLDLLSDEEEEILDFLRGQDERLETIFKPFLDLSKAGL
jgi:hypothetical protein